MAPLRLCLHPNCSVRVPRGRCPAHSRVKEQERGSAYQRGYDNTRWAKARKAFLAEHPLCIDCMERGRVEPATVVDHEIPHKGDPLLFWDVSNWSPRCKPDHDRKTATRDGGFGR